MTPEKAPRPGLVAFTGAESFGETHSKCFPYLGTQRRGQEGTRALSTSHPRCCSPRGAGLPLCSLLKQTPQARNQSQQAAILTADVLLSLLKQTSQDFVGTKSAMSTFYQRCSLRNPHTRTWAPAPAPWRSRCCQERPPRAPLKAEMGRLWVSTPGPTTWLPASAETSRNKALKRHRLP